MLALSLASPAKNLTLIMVWKKEPDKKKTKAK